MTDPSAIVSVIIPTRNRRAMLAEALESVRAQSYANWEAIVVDDGSTDDTLSFVQSLIANDARFRLLPPDPNRKGACAARNRGIEASRADFFIFLDDDDLLLPTCLERRLAILTKHPELDFAVFSCDLFRSHLGDCAGLTSRTEMLLGYEGREADLDLFLSLDFPWGTTGPIWRRRTLDRLGGWDEAMPSWQDWEYHIRAVVLGLKYQKFAGNDYAYRVKGETKKTSVALQALSLHHLRTRRETLGKILSRLEEMGLNDPPQRRRMAALYFYVAEQLTRAGAGGEAAQTWWQARRSGLLTTSEYVKGVCFLRAYGIGKVRDLGRKHLHANHPHFLHVGRSAAPPRLLAVVAGGFAS